MFQSYIVLKPLLHDQRYEAITLFRRLFSELANLSYYFLHNYGGEFYLNILKSDF